MEVLQNWQKILFLCLKYVSVCLYSISKENIFFFQLYSTHKAKFDWTDDCQKSFLNLKQVLSTPPILAFPRTDLPFISNTDDSDHGIGAVCSRVQESIERIIGYYSRLLTKAERNYYYSP